MQEKIVEKKVCKQCNTSFEITDKDFEFYEKISPVFNCEKYQIPTPTLCPNCRQQRRLSFRNERKLYKRKCDATGKDIISMYSPDKSYKIYNSDFWWSDKWESLDYGRKFDFNKTFFEQFNDLFIKVPKLSLSVEKQENSDFSNYSGWNKNCYLIFLGANNFNCYYCNGVWNSENTIDSSYSRYLNNCYMLVDSHNCTNCGLLEISKDCYNCFYSKFLNNCKDCLFSINLNNKQFCILNKQYNKEEFNELKSRIFKEKNYFNNIFDEYKKLLKKSIYRENNNINVINSIGNYINGSENIINCFDVFNSKNCKNVIWLFDGENCYDVYDWGSTASNCYECHKVGDGVNSILFSSFCLSNVSNLIYSFDCVNNSSNCFGCVGLKNKQYCILNKQYTKEEYEQLVPKIIAHMQTTGEWGEFFPSSISPFGYNETVASEYYPLKKQEAIEKGFNWSDYETQLPQVEKIIPASKLPEDIKDIPDDILNWTIECEVTKKPFRIISQELEFYRKHNLPIPRRHPDQRHLDRMILRNPRKLYDRKCDKCFKKIKTTYSPDREEIVYCEECYNKEVY